MGVRNSGAWQARACAFSLIIGLSAVGCGSSATRSDGGTDGQVGDAAATDSGYFIPDGGIPDGANVTIAASREDIPTEDGEALHRSSGLFPVLVTEVAYDVDEEQSLTLADTKLRIETGETWGLANELNSETIQGGELHLYRRFERYHYWPNVLDLTSISALDAELYAQILAEILLREPDAVSMRADIESDVGAGHRVFLVRDYVNQVDTENFRYLEVHYAAVVDLTDETVVEIRAHGQVEDGLGDVHDPLVDALRTVFETDAARWEMCLRGNLRRQKHSAVIVDRADDRFWIRRMHVTCSRLEPPPDEEPPILTVPPPSGPPAGGPAGKGPGPGGKGGAAGGPGGADGVPRIPAPPKGEVPDPPWEPWGFEDEDVGDPDPPFEEGAGGDENAHQPSCNAELMKVDQWLMELQMQLNMIAPNVAMDVMKLNDMRFEWITGQTFGNENIQMAYDQAAMQIDMLQAMIDMLEMQIETVAMDAKAAKEAASEVLKVFWGRSAFWDNMIHVGGTWSNIRVTWVPAFVSSGGEKEFIVFGDREVGAFTRGVAVAMMNGATWAEAVEKALENPRVYPEGFAVGDRLVQLVWVGYAKCLRELYKKQFEEYMKDRWANLSDEEKQRALDALFDGEAALTTDDKDAEQQVQAECAQKSSMSEGLREQIDLLKAEIDKIRRQFLADMRASGAAGAVVDKLMLQQQMRILEAFGRYCALPTAGNALPIYWKKELLCMAINRMLMDPRVEPPMCQALRAYLLMLQMSNCS